ncbi:MAG: hypothetical protein HOH95_03015 [Dehalococcoidia bacterium]|jgi:hypothetical protein|nr:hypothetical protein [Dehalococcoidia bacterium]
MNKQLALAYAATSVATAIAAIAVVGSAFGFGGNPTEPVAEEPVGVAQTVTQLRDALVQQAIAEVEAQRDEAQAMALAEVEAWRASAVAEIEEQLAQQYALGSVGVPGSGAAYAYASYDDDDDDDHDDDDDDWEKKREKHEEDEEDDD